MLDLALDPAAKTGWAHSAGRHGVWLLEAAGSEHAGKRLARLDEHLRAIYDTLGIGRIIYEDSRQNQRGMDASHMHGQYVGTILAFAARRDIPFRTVGTTQLKAFAGHGGYKKHDMIRAAQIKLGIDVTDPDEADACWLLAMADTDALPESANHRLRRSARSESLRQAELPL